MDSINYNVIFGNNFLAKNKIKINFENNAVEINEISGKFSNYVSNNYCNLVEIDYVNIAKSKCKHKLPPKSELIVEVQVKSKQKQSDMVSITPTKHSLDSKWAVSSSIHEFNKKGIYWVKLANFSDDALYINKGTKLVNLEEVGGITVLNEQINSIKVSEIDKDFDLVGGNFNLTNLSNQQQEEMLKLINKHKNTFANSIKDLTGCSIIKHRVYLSDEIPIWCRPYRTPYVLKEELKKQVGNLSDALKKLKKLKKVIINKF